MDPKNRLDCPFQTAFATHQLSNKPGFLIGPCVGEKCALWTKGSTDEGEILEGCSLKIGTVLLAHLLHGR